MDRALTGSCNGYQLTASPVQTCGGRWAVAVRIDERFFQADDGITYILREEAEKEALNLGKNLIKKGIV